MAIGSGLTDSRAKDPQTGTLDDEARRRKNPYMDGSGGYVPPVLTYGMQFSDYGSYGLRQFSGWVREEFLVQLVGREAARVYREMLDNSSVIGSMMFAIIQAMRGVKWRVNAPGDSDKSTKETRFVESLMDDMSHTWEEFVVEALSMLGYGYSIFEIVYKKRLGPQDHLVYSTAAQAMRTEPQRALGIPDHTPSSNEDDGRIGWRRLPIRGQDTVLKWFFDTNGQIKGVTQQPWVGTLIDIPIEKCLLFRPMVRKNNPEGRSVIRNAYRSYWFVKRLEELEAIMFERMSGFPVLYIPNELLEQAQSGGNVAATAALNAYKQMVTNVRINEQMGALLPSDPYRDQDGKPSAMRMFDFQLLTPAHGQRSATMNATIERHKLDMLMTTLCDFIQLGHEVRGTNNLAVTRVDMFYAAIEGWLTSISSVFNRYGLPRIWRMNGLPESTMPHLVPDMATRVDLDGLGNFIANLAKAGMPLFPDDELQEYIRGAAGMPEITSPEATQAAADRLEAETAPPPTPGKTNGAGSKTTQKRALTPIQTMVLGAVAKKVKEMRLGL